jgi:predicted permease
LEFGGLGEIKEACRDARGTRWLEDFVQDCRYGLRNLSRSPVFTSVAVLSLALGIGANTAIFSLMDRVMFRMMPVREPERLVQITRFHPPYGPASVSYPLFQAFQKGIGSFESVLAHHELNDRDITIDAAPDAVNFDLVSGSYFPLLGVHAVIGRTFNEDVDRAPGANAVAVISYRYWQRRFFSDPAAIGKRFRRLNTVFTIIGVTPRDFHGTVAGKEPDITVPLTMDAQVRGGKSWLNEPQYGWLSVMGRLMPGVRVKQAQAEARKAFADIVASDATAESDADRRARLAEYLELASGGNGFDDLRRRFAEPLEILMGTASLVLLLACANLTNLLLARGAARRREIATRLAIGASRSRVLRQLLTEGLLLALAGGAAGVFLAYALAEGLVTTMSNGGSRLQLNMRPDPRMILFALGVSLVVCLLVSLAPAFEATRHKFQATLANGRTGRWRLGKTLIVVQMAVSVVLLIVAGLFGRTLIKMYSLDSGFDRHGVVLFSTNAGRLGYSRERIQEIQSRLPQELSSVPGVVSASISMFPPISGGGWDGTFLVEGHTAGGDKDGVSHINSVGVDFFKTFGTPVLWGREFSVRDTSTSPRVAIVNEAFARHYFRDQFPLGKWVAFAGPEQDTHYEIVGVVKNMKYESIRHDFPRTVYMAASQVPPGPDSYTFSVRAVGGIAAVVPVIEGTLRNVDRALRPAGIVSMGDHVARSLLQERMLSALATFFGVLALLLATVGIYGVMAFQVARRRREIGIRMALGADKGVVIGMILGQTARLTILGSIIGVAAGSLLTRLTKKLLFGIEPNDPVSFAGAVAVLILIALVAAYLPGRGAAQTNPVETLRLD